MFFKERREAGKLLAHALERYKDQDLVVYALPRGGVVIGAEIAKYLHAPLDLIITRKIGHPFEPEYAVAATAENGHVVSNQQVMETIDSEWLEAAIEKERNEAKRRREEYQKIQQAISVTGKIAVLVDDGVATGLTMRAAIKELQQRQPKKIIVAVPIVSQTIADILKTEADELISVIIPSEDEFLGSIGAYYENFPQITDQEVTNLLTNSSFYRFQ